MKLKIRYDNTYQTIEVSEADKDKLWISLSLEGEGLTSEEQEKKIQQAFEERFNRPEYNNWHKFDRHRGESRAKPGKDETDADIDTAEPLLDEVADDRIFRQDELARQEQDDYEEICQWVRTTLGKKQNWADAFIAVELDGMSVNDYAAKVGVSDASIISKYLARARKKLKENYAKRQK